MIFFLRTQQYLQKIIISAFCKMIPQKKIFPLLLTTVMKKKPIAAKHLKHYLMGTGEKLKIDIFQLLGADCGVRKKLFYEIQKSLIKKDISGCVSIPQWCFENKDWQYALGSILVHWQQENDNISLWFEELYFWKPEENRITQALHKKAEEMKNEFAQEFVIFAYGLLSSKSLKPLKTLDKISPFKMYLL